MAPTMVFDAGGKLEAVLGSPGGNYIILYVVKSLIGLIDWQLDAQQAASLLNFGSRGGPFEIEVKGRAVGTRSGSSASDTTSSPACSIPGRRS